MSHLKKTLAAFLALAIFGPTAISAELKSNKKLTDKDLLEYIVERDQANRRPILKNVKRDFSLSQVAIHELGDSISASEEKEFLIKQVRLDEAEFEKIEASILGDWKRSWVKRDTKSFLNLFASNAIYPKLDVKHFLVGVSSRDGIDEYVWSNIVHSESQNKRETKAGLERFLKSFSRIVSLDLDTHLMQSPASMRDKSNLSIREADLFVRFDLRGLDTKGQRRNDRGMFKVRVKKHNSAWKISSWKVLRGEALTAKNAGFINHTAKSGVNNIKSYLRTEAIRRGGYAMSVSDFNGDGNVDMYVGAMGAGELLKGDGKGGFKVVENSGIGKDTLVKNAIFGDFFNTGREDLLLVRFEPEQENRNKNKDIIFYQNLGNGKFAQAKKIQNRSPSDYAMPAAVADYNGDGLLDFYIGFPGAKDFTVFNANVDKGSSLLAQGLFYNNGKGFTDVTKDHMKYKLTHENADIFPHSALATDHDLDGDMDILVIDDRGNLSPFYINDGKGKFHQNAEELGVANLGFGMGAAVGDLDNDGVMDIAYTNVNFLSAERMNASAKRHYNFSPVVHGLNGFRLFKGSKNGRYAEITKTTGIDWAGEGMAGVEFIDYNNDGNLDIYVANGLWSGTEKGQDLSSLFLRTVTKTESEAKEDSKLHNFLYFNYELKERETLNISQSVFMNILRFFKGDIYEPKSKGVERPSMAGHQRNRLYRNNGDGTFTEVGYLEGVDSAADGYIIALSDINKDGRMDLILRNGDPGSKDVNFKPVEVFINNKNKKKSVMLSLKATTGNRSAIGAVVEAKVGKHKYVRHLIANNGTAQSEKKIHFGLDDANKIDQLMVRWPSGKKEFYKDLPAGTHELIEGNAKYNVGMK